MRFVYLEGFWGGRKEIFERDSQKLGVRTRGADQKSKDLVEFAFGMQFEWNPKRN